MAEQQQTVPARAAELAAKIVALLANEDSGTRQRAVRAAVTLLGDSGMSPVPGPDRGSDEPLDADANLADLFSRDENRKPADQAYLCAAHHFSEFGNASFSLDEVRAIAARVGATLPDRLDMTLKTAGKGGKKLFQSVARGSFKPTVHGALYFKDRWSVRPGKRKKERTDNAET